MKCTIGTTNVKEFAKAIQSLSRIGDELYIEPTDDCVSFRTVSLSRSAYFTFEFGAAFFIHYDNNNNNNSNSGTDTHTHTQQQQEQHNNNNNNNNTDEQMTSGRCKLPMKAVVAIFKGATHSFDRTVQKCKIAVDWRESKLVVQICSLYGIVKTHTLSFIECDALQAIYNDQDCPSYMVSEPKVLMDAMGSFQQSAVEEITFHFTPDKLVLKSHVDEPDLSKVHTVVTLANREFVEYGINTDCELTVCLKEVRSLLGFISSVGVATKVCFSGPGSPVIFTFNSKPLYEGTLVLATLAVKQTPTDPQRPKNKTRTYSTLEQNPETVSKHDSNLTFPNQDQDSDSDSTHEQDNTELCTQTQEETQQEEEQQELLDPNALSTQQSNPPASKRSRFYFRRCFESTFNPDSLPGHDVILAEDSDQE